MVSKMKITKAFTAYLAELAGAIVDNFMAMLMGIVVIIAIVLLLLVQSFFFLLFVTLIPLCLIMDLLAKFKGKKK